jgi:hypothetical protein
LFALSTARWSSAWTMLLVWATVGAWQNPERWPVG